MDRDRRLRVTLVAALVVGVVAGVLVSGLLARREADADARGASTSRLGRFDPPHALGHRDHGGVMPAGCEVDPKSPPVIGFDVPAELVDFGSLRQGVQVEKTITVRNTGSGVLCISDVETGCGCVKADWTGDAHVLAGGSGPLRIRIDTTGKEGTLEKSLRVHSNDPARKIAELKVRLDIRLGVVVGQLPGAGQSGINFGTHAPGKAATMALRLKSPKDDPAWEVVGVDSAAPAPEGESGAGARAGAGAERTVFTWKLVPAEPNDPIFRCYDLMLTHPGRTAMGPMIERVKIRTSHPDRPEILLDTQIQVVTKFYSSPVRGAFGFVRKGAVPPSRTILVMAGEATTDFVLTSAEIEGKGFVAAEPRRVKEGWAVDVRYDGQARGGGPVKATLVAKIADPELPELRVPLEATVMGE